LELALAIINNLSGSSCIFSLPPLCFKLWLNGFLIVIACFSKAERNKANLYQIQNLTLFKKNVFFIKIMWKMQKNRSTKGTPLQVLAFARKKWELALAINKQPFTALCIFPLLPLCF